MKISRACTRCICGRICGGTSGAPISLLRMVAWSAKTTCVRRDHLHDSGAEVSCWGRRTRCTCNPGHVRRWCAYPIQHQTRLRIFQTPSSISRYNTTSYQLPPSIFPRYPEWRLLDELPSCLVTSCEWHMDRTERFYKIEQLLISRRAAPISIGRIQVRSTTANAGLAVLT